MDIEKEEIRILRISSFCVGKVQRGRLRSRLGPPSAAGCVEGGGKRVQRVQKVHRVQRVVDCPAGNAYKVSVTGLPSCHICQSKHIGELTTSGGFPPFGALRHHLCPCGKHVTGFSGHCVPLQIQFPCHPAVRWDYNPPMSNHLISISRQRAAKTSPSGGSPAKRE